MSVRTMRERRSVTRTRTTTCRARMCVRSLGKNIKLAREQARKDHTEQERGIEEKELMNGTNDRRDDGGTKGGKKGSKGSKPDWCGDTDKGSNGSKGALVQASSELDIASIAESTGASE